MGTLTQCTQFSHMVVRRGVYVPKVRKTFSVPTIDVYVALLGVDEATSSVGSTVVCGKHSSTVTCTTFYSSQGMEEARFRSTDDVE